MITHNTPITSDVNDKDAIYATRHPSWGSHWDRLLDEDGNPFTDLQEAIAHIRRNYRTAEPIQYIGLSTHTHMTKGNILWDNL